MKKTIIAFCFLIPTSIFSQSIIGDWRCYESVTTQLGEVGSWEYFFYICDSETISTEMAICKNNGREYLRNGKTFYLKKERGNYIQRLQSIFSMKQGESMKNQIIDNVAYGFEFEFIDNDHVYIVIVGGERKLFIRK